MYAHTNGFCINPINLGLKLVPKKLFPHVHIYPDIDCESYANMTA